uniref:Uncharacterized protein n=1 Tax=Chrysotila carterae TaxID=13221 RepID=A0A7S4B305_CHRCT
MRWHRCSDFQQIGVLSVPRPLCQRLAYATTRQCGFQTKESSFSTLASMVIGMAGSIKAASRMQGCASPFEDSHPKPVRAPVQDIQNGLNVPEGLAWLEAGLTRSVHSTPRGVRLMPGMHGLDLRDWLLICSPSLYKFQLEAKEEAMASRKPEVMQACDETTIDAQREVLEMFARYLPIRYPEHFAVSEAGLQINVGGSPLRQLLNRTSAVTGPLIESNK